MDTNKELQEALYELCQATMKVMRIAYKSTIPAELVSDTVRATLQHLVNITEESNISQQMPVINNTPQPQFERKKNDLQKTLTVESQVSPTGRQLLETVYGHNPSKRDGQYLWKSLSEDSDDELYKIKKYSDGTAEFELITLSGSAMNDAWASKGDSLPQNVVTIEGDFKDGATLITIEPGFGKVQGRTVVVVSPCKTEFKNK